MDSSHCEKPRDVVITNFSSGDCSAAKLPPEAVIAFTCRRHTALSANTRSLTLIRNFYENMLLTTATLGGALAMSTLVDVRGLGPSGFVVDGDLAGDDAGWTVSGPGDVNGDGFDDIIIGAPYADLGATNRGAA